jgi:hypothetical protein
MPCQREVFVAAVDKMHRQQLQQQMLMVIVSAARVSVKLCEVGVVAATDHLTAHHTTDIVSDVINIGA